MRSVRASGGWVGGERRLGGESDIMKGQWGKTNGKHSSASKISKRRGEGAGESVKLSFPTNMAGAENYPQLRGEGNQQPRMICCGEEFHERPV